MPRGPRKRSNTGIYHVMLRGSNKQRIFHDKTDYQTFLEGLRKYNSLSCYHLFLVCLLPDAQSPAPAAARSQGERTGRQDHAQAGHLVCLSEESNDLVNTQALLALIPKGEIPAWHEQDDKAECLDVADRTVRRGISDEKAVQVLRKVSGAANLEAFARLSDKRREITLQRMRRAGASLNQIVRLTGTSMAIVRKAVES